MIKNYKNIIFHIKTKLVTLTFNKNYKSMSIIKKYGFNSLL